MKRRRKKRNGRIKIVLLWIVAIFAVATAVLFGAKYLLGKTSIPAYFGIDYSETDEFDNSYVPVSKAEPDRNVAVNITDGGTAKSCGVTDEESELIKEYFESYYVSLGKLFPVNTDFLFAEGADYQKSLCSAEISYLCGVRDVLSVDLGYDVCNVGLKYLSASEENGLRKIELVVNDYVCYDYIPDITSYTCDVEHTFIIENTREGARIYEHSEISGAYTNLCFAYESYIEESGFNTDSLSSEQIEHIFSSFSSEFIDNATDDIKSLEGKRARYNSNPDKYKLDISADHSYDAEAALSYSYEWTGLYEKKRNPSYYEYDNLGGNCNNFTSQCLFAGGIPMDTQGSIECQWKWYGTKLNTDSSASGRSMSWTGVEDFYRYCCLNSGFGLVCDVDSNVFSGRPGDILQYISPEKGVHSVIITKVIYDDDGNVIDYLINSNTTDKVDCPMMTYGYTSLRLIRIVGWNDK